MNGYDVIGDVHGYAGPLERLLHQLGYSEAMGAYRHPSRQAVFVGDLIDRGPDQVRVLSIVRSMVEAGSAQIVLGNHEFNAVAWATRDGDAGWYRTHSKKNRGQHAHFLAQVCEGSTAHADWISWFRTIPLWLDLGGLRVVHACWDERSMSVLGDRTLTDEMFAASKDSDLYEAIEIVLKGPEIDLGGRSYLDKEKNIRHRARFRWWDDRVDTLADGAEIPGGATEPDGSPFAALSPDPLPEGLPTLPAGNPVLYGHYWRRRTPTIDGPSSACLDWSVAKGGPLVAYRWSGEDALTNDHFVAVR